MKNTLRSKKFKSLLPYFLLAIAVIAVYRISGALVFFFDIIGQAWAVVSPFFYGFLLAYIVNIPIGGIQRLLAKSRNKFVLKRQRMLSVLIVFLIFAAIIFLALSLVIPAIADSITFFIDNIHVYWASVMQVIDQINELDLFGLHISADVIFNFLRNMFENFNIESLVQPLSALVGVGTAVFRGAIAFISSIYILIEKDKIKALARRLLNVFASDEVSNVATEVSDRLNNNFRQYIRTQTIDGLILGTMVTISLLIMGSPYALILGLLLGILNYIPYFGSIAGSLIAILVVAFTQGLTMGAISAASLLIIQQIDANIVQPKLMSSSFALSPLLVIISITIGGAIAGILGMLAAIPIVAVLNDMFEGIVKYYERKKLAVLDEENEQTDSELHAEQHNEDQY